MPQTTITRNRLARESSPYLLQHANNPVDWQPWDDAALAQARAEGKPILLSIGYSACHWCHVMAHESFEDEAIAAIMNDHFVNIKVDREERPDIDKIYQTAQQLLTQRGGGWPLTMFLHPDNQRPFFGGTYFPDVARHGMPAFPDLLLKVAEYYAEQQDDIQKQGQRLQEVFTRLESASAGDATGLSEQPLIAAREKIAQSFDREFGGFGDAPKFPHTPSIDRMLRHWRASANSAEPDVEALFMVSLTLARMAEGGIYDQLGGGFCRYSVDRYWQIPHFEKMLYDNAPLLALYSQAYIATGEPLFGRIANETADWMLEDMRSPAGSFYSTRDADSEGEEGRYYVWTPDEARALLSDEEYAIVAKHFGLDSDANFGEQWHLTVRETLQSLAKDGGIAETSVQKLFDSARAKLLRARELRVAPGLDEKQLTSWNALAVRSLSIAARSLDRDDLADAATRAADFVIDHMLIDGRLYASHKDGVSRFTAYLDDHAFLLDGLLELLQVRWNTSYLRIAQHIADLLVSQFYDNDSGGFFFTANDHEKLMHRPKPLADEALPSGNGIAAIALQRLGYLLGESRYLDAAENTLNASWQAMSEFPHGHVTLVTALEEYLSHPEIIVIRGSENEIGRWRDAAGKLYAPRRLVFAIPSEEKDLPGALEMRSPVAGETVAYRCVGSHCSLPLSSWEALAANLGDSPV